MLKGGATLWIFEILKQKNDGCNSILLVSDL